jgi:Uma2 family endonuclease
MALTAQQLADLMPDATQLESNEPEMETSLHYWQLLILVTALEYLWRDRDDYFIGANQTIYFSRQQLRDRDFRGPDFFLVKPTEKHPRKSWVVWEEDGQYPNLIIELLSDSTAEVDRTLKKTLYANRFHTQEYFWFSPETLEFEGFALAQNTYQALPKTPEGYYWSNELQLFLGIYENKLRYFTADKQVVPTPDEAARQLQQEAEQIQIAAQAQAQQAQAEIQQAQAEAQQAQAQAQQAQAEAQQAQAQAQQAQAETVRLAALLRQLGADPDAD